MGLYIRKGRYYYKKQIEGLAYYKALKLKVGQERLLSERLQQVEDEVLAKHFGLSHKSRGVTFLDEYAKVYLKRNKDKKSAHRDKQSLDIICDYLDSPRLAVIGRQHIASLEEKLFARGDGLKPSTVNRYFEVLRALFNQAIEDGLAKENPVHKYYTPFIEDGTRRALSRTEIQKVLDACREIQAHPKSKLQAIFHDLHVFALSTGMRAGEILTLKHSYIQGDMILYPITKTKYRRRSRSQKRKFKAIALNQTARNVIRKQKKKGEYVFDLPRRSSDMIRKNVNKVRRMTEINDYSFHMLRHTVSSVLAQETSLIAAKEILGHADIKTTLKYSHVNFSHLRDGVAKLENYFFGKDV